MKKRYVFLCLLLDLVVIGLIPLNLYCVTMPEWISWVGIAVVVAALLLFWSKGNGKWRSKTILSICCAVAAGGLWAGVYMNPYWSSVFFRYADKTEQADTRLTYAEAKQDVDYVMHYLKKDHPVCLHGMPEDIQKRYEISLEELKSMDSISTVAVEREIQKILSPLKEGHTCIYPQYEEQYYLKDTPLINDEGYDLKAVNGVELEDLFEQNKELYCYEVKDWGIHIMTQDLLTLEGLKFLGISVDQKLEYTYQTPEGKQETKVYGKDDFLPYVEYEKLIKKEEELKKDEPFVSYAIDQEHSLAVLTLNQCRYNEEYKQSVKKMFTEVKEKGLQNVAVDVRKNGGGDSAVIDEFFHYLPINSYRMGTAKWRLGPFYFPLNFDQNHNRQIKDLLFPGKVYVLTSARTFSSAMMFAEYIKDNQLGTIIGEASGNTPTGYGDVVTFQLPNSKLCFQVATKYFHRADQTTKEIQVLPDVKCKTKDAMEVLIQQLM